MSAEGIMTKTHNEETKPEAQARRPSKQLDPRISPRIAGEIGGQPALLSVLQHVISRHQIFDSCGAVDG